MLWVLALACTKSIEDPPPQPPVAEVEDPDATAVDPDPAEEDEPADAFDELGGDEDEDEAPAPSAAPEPIEVAVDAVITKEKQGSTQIMVGADARFTIHMKIEKVEPETPLLPPGQYAVLIHSPSKTFRGPVPGKGKRIHFKMSIFPEDPADPHDEVFFASLWIE
jgi:hypothetical protein